MFAGRARPTPPTICARTRRLAQTSSDGPRLRTLRHFLRPGLAPRDLPATSRAHLSASIAGSGRITQRVPRGNGRLTARETQTRQPRRMQLKEKDVDTGEKSLRVLVEKWFGPSTAIMLRVMSFSRMPSDRRRYVRIEALRPEGCLTIAFFRHDDRSWHVFPQKTDVPAMRPYRIAA